MKGCNAIRSRKFLRVAIIAIGCSAALSSSSQQLVKMVRETGKEVMNIDNLKGGIAAYSASSFHYKGGDGGIVKVELKEPVVVAVASRPEKWGYFQFPKILRRQDQSLLITWNLKADAMEAYGSHQYGAAVSADGGKTWQLTAYSGEDGGYELSNGEKIKIITPKPIKATELTLPNSLGKGLADTYSKSAYEFYRLHDLPEQVNGVFIDRLPKGAKEWKKEKASLYDPEAARYTLRGMFPVLWRGDMHIAKDKSLIAGIYPGFYLTPSGEVDPYHQVFFYRSTDQGRSWKIQGRIPYVADTTIDKKGIKRMGYTEPAYTILPNGAFISVLRTTDGVGNGPMYISRSTDLGVNWTKPEVLTPSGVLPRLLQLKNGVTVLAAGRPGVQLRFSNDGEGKTWSDAFEMLPYKNYSDQVSCGYTQLVATGPDRFLIVYSDFAYRNNEGEQRKAIKVREVIVRP